MKQVKLIDFWVQVALIIGFAMASIINKDYTFIIGYLVVGGWQVLSMLVHYLKDWYTKGSPRFYYQRIALIVIVLMVLAFPLNFLFFVYYIMLFMSPFMAGYYVWICYDEVWNRMKRPLAILK